MRQALDLLEQGAQGRGRLLLLTSELSEPERQGIRSALEHRAARLAAVLGVGTPKGAPVQQEDGSFSRTTRAASSCPGSTKADCAPLRRGDRRRLPAPAAERPRPRQPRLLARGGTLEEDRENALLRLQRWADQGYWLLLPLLLPGRRAGRRGWLFCLPLMLSLPQPAMAFQFEDLWLRPDQQGQRLLQRGQADEAAKRFEDFRWKGLSLYQARDYAAAAQAFAQGDQADDHWQPPWPARANWKPPSTPTNKPLSASRNWSPRNATRPWSRNCCANARNRRSSRPARTRNSARKRASRARHPPAAAARRGDRRCAEGPGRGASTSLPEDEGEKTAGAPAAQPQPDAEDERTGDEEADDGLDDERRQALEQWLRQIRRSRRIAAAQVLVPTAATPGSHAMIRLFCSLLLALLCVSAHASFSASVDRARLTEGESVELTLESDDPTLFGKPDLSPLDALFEVLGTRQVNRLATQNGRAQATTRWIVTLLPKQSGYVAIPPISLGASSTQPIRLHVLEARDRAKSSKLAPVFIDASVDQETVYVQAQAILTLRIYHSVSLYDDSSLTPLAMNDAKVEQLGEARTYEKEINGIRHGVIQVRYAIFPQKSGTLEIPAQAFSATLVDRGSDDYNPSARAPAGRCG